MISLSFLGLDYPSLAGERVTLRFPRSGDFAEWAELRRQSRNFLEKWEPRWAPDELDLPAWRARLRRYRQEYNNGTGASFFIYRNDNGALAGGISIGNIRRGVAQSAQIGYWMGERHAGNGLMLEALRLLVPYCFSDLKLHRIEAACIPDNKRSVRVLEKAGFTREGLLHSYLRISGTWRDHYLYALIEDEYQHLATRGSTIDS
ncbi:GNAT family N-acetyltransferase [Mesorhizobium xinjiangense]|uniref:GNAT family N-acetyltransferase n=1 Tax=Mesorhizobium xinjiangense TaxID=2678685 RepID=UPI0012EE07FB|nr:GNAT family protein [Mesorhizobium xinjiangense]